MIARTGTRALLERERQLAALREYAADALNPTGMFEDWNPPVTCP